MPTVAKGFNLGSQAGPVEKHEAIEQGKIDTETNRTPRARRTFVLVAARHSGVKETQAERERPNREKLAGHDEQPWRQTSRDRSDA